MPKPLTTRWLLALLLVLGLAGARATAQGYNADKPLGTVSQQMPSYLAHAGVEQRLGQMLPLDAVYTDETGRNAPLRSDLTGRPVVMALIYYRCAMLCPQVLSGLARGLRESALVAGKDFDVLVFSIDPEDTPRDAAGQKAQFLSQAHITGASGAASVHFLTARQPAINAIAEATGFHYVKVPGPDGRMDQYAHSSVIMFATPAGRLSKYLSGIDYPARDLRLALMGASAHHISNPVDLVILYCCSYNPAVGRDSVSVLRVLSIAGMIALAMVIGMLFLLTRKPRVQPAA